MWRQWPTAPESLLVLSKIFSSPDSGFGPGSHLASGPGFNFEILAGSEQYRISQASSSWENGWGADSGIDYSDLPRLTEEQLARLREVRRNGGRGVPGAGSVRLDGEVGLLSIEIKPRRLRGGPWTHVDHEVGAA